ncbi:MAG: LysR family transcriptional regulator, partial [Myxococcota bacterium]|nr:LysR family transcriptional regulator [Myxococcota bacterium]
MDANELGVLLTLDALLQEASVTNAAKKLGLSTPAVSHALAKLRERFDDKLLVRAGRAMVLTPRAEELREKVRETIAMAEQVYTPPEPFSPAQLERTYAIGATDRVLSVLGERLDKFAREEAPRVALRFRLDTLDDAEKLRDGDLDLAVGIYGDLPPELRTRALFTDRLVCVVRRDHPVIGEQLSLDQFLAASHIQVAPKGQSGEYIDMLLARQGKERVVSRQVPFLHSALTLAASTDDVLTISERLAAQVAPTLGLRLLEPPLELEPYTISLVWHPRNQNAPGHVWLRELFARAAVEEAPSKNEEARKKLDDGDSAASAPPRKKKKKK